VELAAPQFLTAQRTTATVDKVASVYGAKVHYVDAGNRFAGDFSAWTGRRHWSLGIGYRAACAKYASVALDQIGFGLQTKPLLNYRVSTFVDFLDGFLNELKMSGHLWLATPLGGMDRGRFCINASGADQRLVLCDAAGYGSVVKNDDPRALSALRLASRDDIRYLGRSNVSRQALLRRCRSCVLNNDGYWRRYTSRPNLDFDDSR